jgi:hypothetical protein
VLDLIEKPQLFLLYQIERYKMAGATAQITCCTVAYDPACLPQSRFHGTLSRSESSGKKYVADNKNHLLTISPVRDKC